MKIRSISNKKGVSPIIGYVLLIVGVLISSALVFVWLKTYVPQETVECPAEASLFIKNIECSKYESTGAIELRLGIKNNGLFNLDGFFIHATDDPEQTLATIDLVQFLPARSQEEIELFFDGRQPLKPNEEVGYVFDITGHDDLETIEIIPARFEDVDRKRRFTACGNDKIEEIITCVDSPVEETI